LNDESFVLASVSNSSRSARLSPEASDSYAPPAAFGRFRVLHQIGAGVLGPVFRALEAERDRVVAVKVFRIDLTPEQAAELAAGLQRLADLGLTHPAIATPLAAGVEGTVAYLAEEYIAAESLDVALRQYGPAPVSEGARLVTQLAGAIDFAAAAGVHHGRLHPRDVLVTAEAAHISGFGVAAALERTGFRAPIRRPYVAPERHEGAAWDVCADVFSLAAVAHELLTGRRIAASGGAAIADLDGIATVPGVREVFTRALDPDPQCRFPDALAFAAALQAAVTASEGPVPRETHERSARIRSLRRPAAPMLPLDGEGQEAPLEPAVETKLGIERPSPAGPIEALDMRSSDAASPESPATIEAEPAAAARPLEPDFDKLDAVARAEQPADELPLRLDEELLTDYRAQPVAEPQPVGVPDGFTEPENRTGPAGDQVAAPVPGPIVEPAGAKARTPMLPFALTLAVGLFVGFLAGYGLGSRERPYANPPASAATSETGLRPAAAGPTGATAAPSRPPSPRPPVAAGPSTARSSLAPGPPPAARTPSTAAGAKARPSAATRTGRLSIRSVPSGAAVSIDGQPRGRTPVVLRSLSYGAHTVRVTRPGFEPKERRVSLGARRPALSLSVVLERVRESKPAAAEVFVGSLSIESRPPGATIYLDDRRVGTTPAVLASVPVGSHVVRLELPGYQRWSAAVTVTAGERSRVTASLGQDRER
jgi:serine/threonine protein kinase